MTATIRFYTTGLVMAVALVGVAVAQPAWLADLGIEIAQQPRQSRQQTQVVFGTAEEYVVYEAKDKAKNAIVNQLRSGELDLFQAANWFRHVNQELSRNRDRALSSVEGNSDDEKHCRQVIRWAKSYFENSMPSSELALLVTKLEGQLSDRLRQGGRIELSH